MIHTHDKGDIAEAAVIYDLTKRGFTVFKPLSQNTYADLIACKGTRIETIQVKYVTPKKQSVSVMLGRYVTNSSTTHLSYTYNSTPLHWIAIYNSESAEVYYIPRSKWEQNTSAITLRLTPPKNNQSKGVSFASDYTTI
jgi:hypothetical protein